MCKHYIDIWSGRESDIAVKRVTSAHNEAFKLAKKLKVPKGIHKEGAFLVEGWKLVREAMGSGLSVDTIFVRDDGRALPIEFDESLQEKAVLIDEKLFSEIADTVTPQGITAIVRKPDDEDIGLVASANMVAKSKDKSTKELRVIVLDRISDPGNVGTIIRTALAAGFDMAVLVRGAAEAYSLKVIRAGAGAVFHLPLAYAKTAEVCVDDIKSLGLRLIVCDTNGANLYKDADISGGIAFVIGNEANGPADGFLKNADEVVRIPMVEQSESLNAGVAAGIVMFEKYRVDYR